MYAVSCSNLQNAANSTYALTNCNATSLRLFSGSPSFGSGIALQYFEINDPTETIDNGYVEVVFIQITKANASFKYVNTSTGFGVLNSADLFIIQMPAGIN